jgi:hypothetical protein
MALDHDHDNPYGSADGKLFGAPDGAERKRATG